MAEFYIPPTYGPGAQQLGTLDQIQAARLAQGASAASQTQASKLLAARLANSTNQLRGSIPVTPTNVPGNPTLPSQPLALEAGAPPVEARIGTGALGLTAEEAAALSGGARTTANVAGGRFGGLGGTLKDAFMNGGEAGGLGAYTGGGAIGAAKVLGSRLGMGGVAAIAPNLEGQIAEQIFPNMGAAQAGADVGTGAMIGTLIAPGPGTAIGAALGGAKDIIPLAGELGKDFLGSGVAQDWGTETDRFNKIISKAGKHNVGVTGHDYLNDTYFDKAQQIKKAAEAGDISHGDAVSAMSKLNDSMVHDVKILKRQYQKKQDNKGSKSAVAIQMANAFDTLNRSNAISSQGVADAYRAQAAGSDPALAAILNSQAAAQEANANTSANAYKAALMVTPQINQMDAQLNRQAQLIQQQMAVNAAAKSGASSSISAGIKAATKP